MNQKMPLWAWIVIIILSLITILLLINNYNSVSLDKYAECASSYGEAVESSLDLTIDYLNLLGCYQKAMPTCDILIQKYGNASVFTQQAGN